MGWREARLVLEPVSWSAALSAVAGAALLAEAWGFLRHGQTAGRRLASAVAAAGVLAGGAVLAWVWWAWVGELTPLTAPLSGAGGLGGAAGVGGLSSAGRLCLLAAMPLIAAACLAAVMGLGMRLGRALSGRTGAGAFALGAARGLGVLALAALTVLWAPHGSLAAIGAAAIHWAVRAYRRTTSPVGRLSKVCLLGLRIMVILLVLGWAFRPALEYRRQEELPILLLVLADTSSSMDRRDVVVGRGAGRAASQPAAAEPPDALPPDSDGQDRAIRRIEAMRDALDRHRSALKALARKAEIELVPFAATALPGERFDPDKGWSLLSLSAATGAATALGDSLAEACDRYAAGGEGAPGRGGSRSGPPLAGVVVISDGCNNTADVIAPEKAAALLRSRGVPVHTVAVGSDRVTAGARTLTVRDLVAPDEVEAFNRLPIAATVEAMGLRGRQIKVTCRFGQEEVGSETFSQASDEAEASRTVRFNHVPLSAGFHRAAVIAEVVGGPPQDLAGRQAEGKLVHVVDREMRVLYVEGRFRYEAKYLAQALVAARRFTLDRRVLLRPLGENQPPPLSENLDDWLAYHAIILGDVAASHFTDRQLRIIRDLVGKYGKGLCMIGGDESFGRGGWQASPLADVMPVDLAASSGQTEGPVQVVPTPDGRQHDLMRIGPEASDVAADWARLDPLAGANQLAGVKPAAAVLASTPQGLPLIVAQTYGKGRSLAIAFDTTWQWVLSKKDTAELQRRFWRQVVLFLAAPKGSAWVVTDKTSYDLRRLARSAEAVRISAGVEDSHGRPLADAPVEVRLIAPDGKASPVALAAGDKMRTGQLGPLTAPGTYTLTLQATVGGKALAAEHRFEVVQPDLESLEVLANHGLLRRMAAAGNGRFATIDGLGDLLRQLQVAVQPEVRQVASHVRLSDSLRWPVVAGAIALLCAEWAWRKRKGLV